MREPSLTPTSSSIPVTPLSAQEFKERVNISEDVLHRLEAYLALLGKWQRRLNLVGASTISDSWRRHFLDSAQLAPHIGREYKTVADIGSGAGFPGLVLAIMGVPGIELVESNLRKCQFLEEVARATGTQVRIHPCRAEALDGGFADLVTARAVAPLDRLLVCAHRILRHGGRCLFLKGRQARQELTAATKSWNMRFEIVPSLTDPSGAILKLEGIVHRRER